MRYKKQFIIFIIIVFCALFYYAARPRLITVSYDIESTKVNEPVKLAVIADLHSSSYGENQENLVQIIEAENPDFIVWVGDIIEEDTPIDNSITLIEMLAAYNNYYVSGNHDVANGDFETMKEIMRAHDFTILSGDTALVELGDTTIQISGIDDPLEGSKYATFQQLDNCGTAQDPNLFALLLAHRPEYIDTYKTYAFDLTLSGHAHGGQWIVPGLINGVFAPGQGFFPEYAGGHYTVGSMDFIVSRGLALNSPAIPPRIFNPCEILFVTINPV